MRIEVKGDFSLLRKHHNVPTRPIPVHIPAASLPSPPAPTLPPSQFLHHE